LNCSPISVKVFFSEAAANTMIFPPADAVVDELAGAWSDEPHPLIRASASAKNNANTPGRFTIDLQ
jgi:hypothetical protein